ncbi:MAG: glycosyltransferase [Proteobacteria bacterium]|nr:glycosyltransferase [Pseudomonadota bacterium]
MPGSKKDLISEYVLQSSTRPDEYLEFIGPQGVERLNTLALPLEGKGWANVNSSPMGGGVAEMLKGILPLARGLGIDAHWHVLQSGAESSSVTQKIRNLLQGMEQDISMEEIFRAYVGSIDKQTRETFITSDLVVVHDPQPAAMVMNGVIYGNVLWHCPLDTSEPDMTLWRFLLPYINHCAGAIFARPEFVRPGVQIPVYQIMPGIDPLCEKNRLRTRAEALDALAPLLGEHGIDPERPILAAIARFDPHKNQASVLRAFCRMRDEVRLDPAPQLLFLGNTFPDDLEGEQVLAQLRELADGDPDIHFLVNVQNNDAVVGSLMSVARGVVHTATRAGFGLTVTEALWQRTPVIGANRGGIRSQVIDGRTGFLVEPEDPEAIAKAMARLLQDDNVCSGMGEAAHEHVRRELLLPHTVGKYLELMRYYASVDRKAPDFRLSDLTYSEVLHAMRPRPPFFPDA